MSSSTGQPAEPVEGDAARTAAVDTDALESTGAAATSAPEADTLHVTPWELPAYYADLKARIIGLETAWEEGALRLALEDETLESAVGRDVYEAYRRLAAAGPPRFQEFRRASLHALLDETKQLLVEPEVWFRAHPQIENRDDDEDEIGSRSSARFRAIEVDTDTGSVTLRLRQVQAVAFWGIGFELDLPAHGDRLATLLVRRTLRRLGSDLHGLHVISRWLGHRPRSVDLQIVPDPVGRRFEQLMLDIMNEEEDMALRAPLFEDFLQKTDMRVHLPDLGRPRGARVQVTQTIHSGQHDEKLARIRRLEEFVILSPRSLAIALGEKQGATLLSGPDRDHFWLCIESRPASVEELATALKSIFLGAIQRAHDDPRGPCGSVPDPVRLLVRNFIVREAYRTTAELRRRELREGKWQDGSPKLAILDRFSRGDDR